MLHLRAATAAAAVAPSAVSASASASSSGAGASARRALPGRPLSLLRREQARGLKILAIGNTIIDTVLTMGKIPVDDKVWIRSKKTFVGGQGANAAQDMARLGLQVSFVTRLGDDKDGHWARDHYRAEGIGTEHCIMVPGAQTMSACVTIGAECMTRCCYMHKDETMFAYDMRPHLRSIDFSAYDLVYSDGHQTDLALPLVRAASEHGLPIVADMEVLDDETRELFDLATDVVAPAKTLEELAGSPDPGTAALELVTASSEPRKTVIATQGELGSYGARRGDRRATHVPAHTECRAFDTLGAGDAYHAGYVTSLSRLGAEDLAGRMAFATAVAAALCETPGPVVSLEALTRFGIEAPPRRPFAGAE